MDKKAPIRLGTALLKDAIIKITGEKTLDALADAAPADVARRFDAWLGTKEAEHALEKAMLQADACFVAQVQDETLKQWMQSLPLRTLPALQTALAALPESPDANALEAALRTAIARDWPGLSPLQQDFAARHYLFCLRRSLLPVEEQALQVIGRSVLRMEEQLLRLEAQLAAWMEQEQRKLESTIQIGGSVYQGVVISGNQNQVQYITSYYLIGSIWDISPEQLPPPPALILREEEKSYLRLLRDQTDRVRLAEDYRSTKRDRQQQEAEKVALHRVYVNLATKTAPAFADVLDRLEIPDAQRDALREEINRWIQKVGNKKRNLSVDKINNYAGLLQKIAESKKDDAKHPLSRWANDQAALQQALAPITAVEALAKQKKLVLLGDPGSGKSTFANHLAYILAGAMLNQALKWRGGLENRFDTPLFPLLVVMRRWSGSLKPGDKPGVELAYRALEAATQSIDRKTLLMRLSSPHTLVMFDGLDESPIAESAKDYDHRGVILESIRQFRIAHPYCRVLVTSRIHPYDNPHYQVAGWPAATLAPLDELRIERFVGQWYKEMWRVGEIKQKERAEEKGRRLLNAIQSRKNLGEMAGTPLLLTMLAIVNTRSDLPEKRVELYQKVVQQLLWEWDKKKAEEGNVSSLTLLLEEPRPEIEKGDFEKMLWGLTYEAHARSGQNTAEISIPEMEDALVELYRQGGRNRHDAKAWVSRVIALMQERSGLLLPDADDTFIFPHRSFQEYLAARWLVTLRNPGKEFLKLIENDIWHEVILLACSHLTTREVQADGYWFSIVERLARGMRSDLQRWQAPLLAGIAWREYGYDKLDEEDADLLLEHLNPDLTTIMQAAAIPLAQRLEAGLILADLGALPDDLDDLISITASHLGYSFRIGKYLVTNHQYQRFMDAGGYNEDKPWWTEEAVRDIEKWSLNKDWRNGPRYQNESRFNKATQPVVGITWYEAEAYCQWLTEVWREEGKIGRDEEARLPTEQEWEAAAGPTRYVWGDNFAPNNINFEESGLAQTTPVHMYRTGATSMGVHDLTGNVWEWMLHDHEIMGKVVRGGSWRNDTRNVTARDFGHPRGWLDNFGFRVVVVPISR